MIGREEFDAWLLDPVTQEVRRVLAAKRADLRNEWEMSNPTSYARDEFVLGNVGNIGWCRGLAFAEMLDYETYQMEIDPDGQQQRTGPPRSRGPDKAV